MQYCGECGTRLREGSLFCHECGAKVAHNESDYNENSNQNMMICNKNVEKSIEKVVSCESNELVKKKLQIPMYKGEQKFFTFMGRKLVVTEDKDTFNYYRKLYSKLAKKGADALKKNYLTNIINLDLFLSDFFNMYLHYRKPLIDATVDLLTEAGIYDVSQQIFEEQHTTDFCLCREDVKVMIDSFNLTIEANQNKKIRAYNMMPGVVFSGFGGLIAATALNVAVTAIAEADIKNANVTQAQRKELFGRINIDNLMYRAYLDYWRIFLSFTWLMNNRHMNVWYPTTEKNQRAKGLFQNLTAGRLPEDKVPDLIIDLLQLNPYDEEYLSYIIERYGETDEIMEIKDYFSV
ncbi:MAG: zinc ribbon domain-containing protein [Lachnospiraceae bacterium]|nr:zinc ribbon domain-containing protein [Lachnospiraceae bacterium]